MITRRSILGGLLAAIAAPHIPKSIAAPVAQVDSLRLDGVCLLVEGDEFTIAGVTDSRGRPMVFRTIRTTGDGLLFERHQDT